MSHQDSVKKITLNFNTGKAGSDDVSDLREKQLAPLAKENHYCDAFMDSVLTAWGEEAL